jgi:hypothetical protein
LEGLSTQLAEYRVAEVGFVMALLYSTPSVFPMIGVPSWRVFALKIVTVILVANVIGVGIDLSAQA